MKTIRSPMLTVFLACALALAGCSKSSSESRTPPVEMQNVLQDAAVAMPDIYGAAVSEQILSDGGNAVDAAIAAGLVLAVTFPEAGNIGGG